MRTITTVKNVYKFDELTDEQKQKAIECLYDINIDCKWRDSTFEDAKNVGLKIKEFTLNVSNFCDGYLIGSGMETADKIIKEHGDTCGTYKLSKQFIEDWNSLVEKYSDGKNTLSVTEENIYDFDGAADELEDEFLNGLLDEYLSLLKKEYEYLTSEAAIVSTIEANGYEFTEEGEIA